jgi:hypothetical protein
VSPYSLVMAGGWTGEVGALLERAVARHGGWAAWQALRCVTVELRALSGMVPVIKGVGPTFPAPARIDVFPQEYRAVFHHYPSAGRRGVFSAGAVQIVDTGGAVVTSSPDHRRSLRGLSKWRRWSPADALYFFGYAVTHYHGLPFTLADARPLRLSPLLRAPEFVTALQ